MYALYNLYLIILPLTNSDCGMVLQMETKNVWFFVARGNMVKICGWQCLLQNANNCIQVHFIRVYI